MWRQPPLTTSSSMSAKTLSIIIPVYNEEATVVALLDRVLAAEVSARREIIIVNDGSTDRSRERIQSWRASLTATHDVTVRILDKANGGKGSAVRAGIEQSSGDAVIIQDADLEYDPADYQKCIDPILAGRTRVVYGSRERFHGNRFHSSLAFYAGGLAVTYWVNLLYGASLTDEPTCYKTFDGDLIRTLSFDGDGFEWEPEITAKLLRLGYAIHEVPVSYAPRKVGEGKKINWRDGLRAFWVALMWRLLPMGEMRRRLAAMPAESGMLKSRRRQQRWLWLLIGSALCLRLAAALPGLAAGGERFMRPDSATYIGPAMALLTGGSFNKAPDVPQPETRRVPGYSVFLAAVFRLTGGGKRLPVLLFCLLSALTCIPIFRAGAEFGGTAVGVVAAALFALNLTGIARTPFYLSDTVFVFVCAWMFYFFVRFYFRERLVDLWAAVALNGIATLIRPIGLMWIVPCLFLVLIFQRKSWGKRICAAAVCGLLFFSMIMPWMARNEAVGAGFRLGSNIGRTLYFHNCAALLSVVTGESAETLRRRWISAAEFEFEGHPDLYPDEAARTQYLIDRAKAIIGRHPLTYARLHFRPAILLPDAPAFFEILGLTQTGRGTLDVLNRLGLVAAVRHYFGDRLWLLIPLLPALGIVLVTYIGCAVQLCRWAVRRQVYLLFVFLAFVVYYLVLPGPIVMPRYQLPALPMMAVMAAIAMKDGVTAWKARLQAAEREGV